MAKGLNLILFSILTGLCATENLRDLRNSKISEHFENVKTYQAAEIKIMILACWCRFNIVGIFVSHSCWGGGLFRADMQC